MIIGGASGIGIGTAKVHHTIPIVSNDTLTIKAGSSVTSDGGIIEVYGTFDKEDSGDDTTGVQEMP
jgi:hypothetical protein